MMAVFRRLAKSWVAKILFGVLIIAFGGYGVNSMLHGKISDDVITAGSRSISAADFKSKIDSEKKQYEREQTNGQVIPMEDLVKQGIVGQMAQELATQEAFAAWLEQVGLKPSDKVVADQLRQVQAFFNPVTGAFDKDSYDRALQGAGLTEKSYESDLKDDIAAKHFLGGVRAGISMPRIYAALEAITVMETRDASWMIVGPKNITMPDKPTDAQLNQFINDNAARFRRPELRFASAVMFVPAAVAKDLKVSDDDLKKAYDFRKDSLSQPETRSFVVIPTKTPAAAAAIVSSLKAGTDPQSVAKTAGSRPIAFDNKPKSAVPDEAVANQAFSMQSGEVSQPVRGTLGLQVIKLISVTPGHAVSFEEAKPALEGQLKQKLAAEKIDELVEKYQGLRDKGVSMADAAKQLGLPMQSFPPFTKEGYGANGQPYMQNGQPFAPPKPLLDSLFSHTKGGESDVEDAGGGIYFALRVDNVIPSALPQVNDQTRAPLTGVWMQQEVGLRLKAKADEITQAIRKGESLQAAAQSIGAQLQTQQGINRPRSAQEPDAQVHAAAFNTSPKDAFEAPTNAGFAVGQVTAVHAPATAIAAKAVETVRPQLSQAVFRDLAMGSQQAVKKKLKAKVNQDLIGPAVGVADTTAADKKKK